jgi:hypothetical protein
LTLALITTIQNPKKVGGRYNIWSCSLSLSLSEIEMNGNITSLSYGKAVLRYKWMNDKYTEIWSSQNAFLATVSKWSFLFPSIHCAYNLIIGIMYMHTDIHSILFLLLVKK